MPEPVASVTLTTDDLLRAAAPRLLSDHPRLSLVPHWRVQFAQLADGGVRIDFMGPSEGDKP